MASLIGPLPVTSKAFLDEPVVLSKSGSASASFKGSKARRVKLNLSSANPPADASSIVGPLLANLSTLLAPLSALPKSSVLPYNQLYKSLLSLLRISQAKDKEVGRHLYDQVQKIMADSAESIKRDWRGGIMSREGDDVFRAKVLKGWTWWCERIAFVSHILLPLDTIWTAAINVGAQPSDVRLPTVIMSRFIFVNTILKDNLVKEQLIKVILSSVQYSRSMSFTESISAEIEGLVKMLHDLELFDELVLEPLKARTEEFYIDNAKQIDQAVVSGEKGAKNIWEHISLVLQKEEALLQGLLRISPATNETEDPDDATRKLHLKQILEIIQRCFFFPSECSSGTSNDEDLGLKGKGKGVDAGSGRNSRTLQWITKSITELSFIRLSLGAHKSGDADGDEEEEAATATITTITPSKQTTTSKRTLLPASPWTFDSSGLGLMMLLLRRCSVDLSLVKDVWSEKVKSLVEDVVGSTSNTKEKDSEMIPLLLSLKSQVDDILFGPFSVLETDGSASRRERTLADGAYKAFETVMGKRGGKVAELIAKQIDLLLRSAATNSPELDKSLDGLMGLVRFTRDKDVFKAFYVTALAKRLLLGRSASDDAELSMVSRLKRELGDEFTTGDGMMADLQLSASLMKSYRNKHRPEDDMDLNVSVLSAANWPSYNGLEKGWENFALPTEFASALNSFHNFYTSSHQGRLLDFRHQLGSMTLTARFPKGKKELSVSLFQGLVLLGFNNVDDGHKVSFVDIQGWTGIETNELCRTLQSLACGKIRPLVKTPASRDISPATDMFSFNEKLSNDKIRLKINQIQQNQTVEEDQKIEERVMGDRTHLLDAAIVRIMKGKKKLTWIELTNQVVDAVKRTFPPNPKDIKKQIESLIEREYLARDEVESRTVLHYLA